MVANRFGGEGVAGRNGAFAGPVATPSPTSDDVAARTAQPPVTLEPLLVDLPQVAHLLSVSVRTAKRLARAGELPGVRRVRRRLLFCLVEVRDWVARGCPGLSPRLPRGRAGRAHTRTRPGPGFSGD
jgi:hypothetical protein